MTLDYTAAELASYLPQVVVLRNAALACLSLSIVSVSLRIYVRVKVLPAYGADDSFMLAALAGYILMCALIAFVIGWLPIPDYTLRIINISSIGAYVAYYITLVLLKISLAIFFLRIFILNRHIRTCIYVAIALNALGALVRIFYIAVKPCQIDVAVYPEDPTKCTGSYSFFALGAFVTFLAAFTDLGFAVISIWAILKMRLRRLERAIATLLLVLGTLSGIVSFIRFATVILRIEEPGSMIKSIKVSQLSVIELGLGIIAASLATLRPLLRKIYRHYNPAIDEDEDFTRHPVSKEATRDESQSPSILSPHHGHHQRFTRDSLFFLHTGRFKDERRQGSVVLTTIEGGTANRTGSLLPELPKQAHVATETSGDGGSAH